MKKITAFIVLLIIAAMVMRGQTFKPYPIPSFDIPVDGFARFQEFITGTLPGQTDAKKTINTMITKRVSETPGCTATEWIYSLDGLDILGPYTISCGIVFPVIVDDRAWGVIIESEENILVDVWIEGGYSTGGKQKQKKPDELSKQPEI